MDIAINIDEKATALAVSAQDSKSAAVSIQVRTPREYEQASTFLRNVKVRAREIDEHRKYLKEPYLEGGRRIDEFFRQPLAFLADAEREAKRKMLGYEDEQRRLAAEEQRKLQEKARKEREALEAKARAAREKADAEAAEIKRKADEARAAGDLAQAVTLTNQADRIVEKSETKAITLESKAEQVAAPTVQAYIPPVEGISRRTVWKARVVDVSLVPREYLLVNEQMLAKVAQATKGSVAIPGVEFYSEQTLASARAR